METNTGHGDSDVVMTSQGTWGKCSVTQPMRTEQPAESEASLEELMD